MEYVHRRFLYGIGELIFYSNTNSFEHRSSQKLSELMVLLPRTIKNPCLLILGVECTVFLSESIDLETGQIRAKVGEGPFFASIPHRFSRCNFRIIVFEFDWRRLFVV